VGILEFFRRWRARREKARELHDQRQFERGRVFAQDYIDEGEIEIVRLIIANDCGRGDAEIHPEFIRGIEDVLAQHDSAQKGI